MRPSILYHDMAPICAMLLQKHRGQGLLEPPPIKLMLRWAKSCDSYRRIVMARVVAAIRITRIHWWSYLVPKHRTLVLRDLEFVAQRIESRDCPSLV